jgi:hypothetical protein
MTVKTFGFISHIKAIALECTSNKDVIGSSFTRLLPVITRQNFGSSIHTALKNFDIQYWPYLAAFVTSVWQRVALKVSIPSRKFYNDKLAKFIIPIYDYHNYQDTCKSWVHLIQNRILEEMRWKKLLTVLRHWMILWMNLRVRCWCSFRHNGTFTRPTRYSETVYSTYGF